MSDICFKDGHLTSNAFLMLDTDMLDNSQKLLMLSHLDNCDICMAKFIENLDDASLIPLLNPIEVDIFEKIALEKQEHNAKKSKVRHIQYVKLAVTACMTMVVCFGSSQLFMNKNMAHEIEQAPTGIEEQKKQEHNLEHNLEKQNRFDFFDKAISDFHQSFFDFSDIINNSFKKGDNKNDKLARRK